ncbi:PD-(D/E)XK nuclease family protein [Bifidobacterium mongoliense]|uniref:PD-(D/E)XK nuclease family protein n=1 Tax=Bifidobacterium mongoliense TaxID=518643 RepID=UPI0030EB2F3D
MKNEISKNLFDYATSELSQDAFLCWLAANWDSEDESVHASAQNLLFHCINTAHNGNTTYENSESPAADTHMGQRHEDIQVHKIERQHQHIDVYLELNYMGRKYAVIIEDKTQSRDHDDQLNRYYEELSINPADAQLVGLYFKSDFVPERSDINESMKGTYIVMDYNDILGCLSNGSTNLILQSYRDRLQEKADHAQEFRSKAVKDWNTDQFCAFFESTLSSLHSIGLSGSFGRNDNRNGGRYSMWFGNQRKLGPHRDSFHLNLETANKNPNGNWACRMIVRWDGDGTGGRRSRRDFELPQIGDRCSSMKSQFAIMGRLFDINSNSTDGVEELTDKINDAIATYQTWCDANASE